MSDTKTLIMRLFASPRTTVAGLVVASLLAISLILQQALEPATYAAVQENLNTVAIGILAGGSLVARDNGVSSEDAGAVSTDSN